MQSVNRISQFAAFDSGSARRSSAEEIAEFEAMFTQCEAVIQAYVFTLLSAIYFGSATEESHSHDEHPADGHHVVPEQEQQLII